VAGTSTVDGEINFFMECEKGPGWIKRHICMLVPRLEDPLAFSEHDMIEKPLAKLLLP
jgi:hypothetical protein